MNSSRPFNNTASTGKSALSCQFRRIEGKESSWGESVAVIVEFPGGSCEFYSCEFWVASCERKRAIGDRELRMKKQKLRRKRCGCSGNKPTGGSQPAKKSFTFQGLRIRKTETLKRETLKNGIVRDCYRT
jgi:hypothetical protein